VSGPNEKNEKQDTAFPAAQGTPGQTIISQIGSERFAIHMEVEDLPPPAAVIQFSSSSRKGKSIK
jgi:hypothetical protein